MKTTKVKVAPSSFIEYMRAHDDAGNAYSFNAIVNADTAELEMWVDSSATAELIILKADGTWYATTRLLISNEE